MWRGIYRRLIVAGLLTLLDLPARSGDELERARQALAGGDRLAAHSMIELIERQREKGRLSADLLVELGSLQVQVGELEAAQQTLLQLEAMDTSERIGLKRLTALIAQGQQKKPEEEAAWRAILELDPSHTEARSELAQITLTTNRPAEASELLSGLLQDPSAFEQPQKLRLMLDLVTAQTASGQWAQAAETVRTANAVAPEDTRVQRLLPFFERIGAPTLAEVEQLAKNLLGGSITAEQCLRAGVLLAQAGFHQEALPFFVRQYELAPGRILPRLMLGEALTQAGRGNETGELRYISNPFTALRVADIEEFGKLDTRLLSNPDDPEARYEKAWRLNEVKQYLLALDHLSELLEKKPDDPRYLMEAAFANFHLDRIAEALPLARRSISLDPDNAPALRLLGAIEVRVADFPAAAETFTRALAIENNESARTELERIKKILSPR